MYTPSPTSTYTTHVGPERCSYDLFAMEVVDLSMVMGCRIQLASRFLGTSFNHLHYPVFGWLTVMRCDVFHRSNTRPLSI